MPELPVSMKCSACGGWDSVCMLQDAVWERVWPEHAVEVERDRQNNTRTYRLLCFVCIETRLGRHLTENDFNKKVPINFPIMKGIRIGERS
jgi:trehalose/maltose hydrolase-like predicted phosphorylase